MPLIHSSSDQAFKSNVRAEISAGKPQKQALAIAYSIKRRGKASGGGVSTTPWYTRQEARGMSHVGPISSIIGGRTDHHKMSVPSGAYVLPADVVSGIGQGNTGNGHAVLSKMFASGPYGASMPGLKIGKRKFADGGEVGEATPIMAAGGEYVIDPQAVTKVGGGDLDHGHKILDAFVKHIRSKTIKTLQKLPGPARD